MRPRLLAPFASVVLGVFAFPYAVALADAASPSSSSSPPPKPPTYAALGHQAIDATAKYNAKDFAGAADGYRKILAVTPNDNAIRFALGEALLASGDPSGAEAEWTRLDSAGGETTPRIRGKALFSIARLREAQKRWDDAKAAYKAYEDYAAAHPTAGAYPASADGRTQAIDKMTSQDKAYDVVRKRIADAAASSGAAPTGAPVPTTSLPNKTP